MLQIVIPLGPERWDEETERFLPPEDVFTLELEHSLVSISKWESKWHKPFFTEHDKTAEEAHDYIKCMTITPNVDPVIFNFLTEANIDTINEYIKDPMTATTFSKEEEQTHKKETITSEIIYYWMFKLGIPLEFEKRHINSLLTLVRVFNIKEAPPKKMSQKEAIARNKSINARNKALLASKGGLT